MNPSKVLVYLVAVAVLTSSCGIVYRSELEETANILEEGQASLGEDLVDLESKVFEIEARLDALEHRIDAVGENVSVLREGATEDMTGLRESMGERTDEILRRLDALERSISEGLAEEGRKRRADKDELTGMYQVLLEEVTKENENLRERLDALEAGGVSSTHVVRSGETLSAIADQYDVTVDDIARANGITNPNRLRVGQELVIP
jgi:nucleoid-associated protein YgaU